MVGEEGGGTGDSVEAGVDPLAQLLGVVQGSLDRSFRLRVQPLNVFLALFFGEKAGRLVCCCFLCQECFDLSFQFLHCHLQGLVMFAGLLTCVLRHLELRCARVCVCVCVCVCGV